MTKDEVDNDHEKGKVPKSAKSEHKHSNKNILRRKSSSSKKLDKPKRALSNHGTKTFPTKEHKGNGPNTKDKNRPNIKIKKKKKYVLFGTKKIVHDPKVIGCVPSLPLFYQQIIIPVRDRHNYNDITKSVGWDSNEILAKPTVLVVGASEAGKTSLINYLLREKKGYESHYDVVKDYKSSFTHIAYDDNPSLLRGADAVAAKSWAFNEMTRYNKQKNDCQFQFFQYKHELLQDITFIDSPPISESMLGDMDKDTTGYYPILSNLIRKVDLIFFVATSSIVSTSMNKIISLLNPYNYKTVFCLSKSDQYRSLADLSEDRKNFNNYIIASISSGEPKVICTYFKGILPCDDMKEYVHNDMETLLAKIKRFPTQYKFARFKSLQIHMLEILYIAFVHHELRRKEKTVGPKGLLPENIVEINKCFDDIPNHDDFVKNFSKLPEEVFSMIDKIKPKSVLIADIDCLRSFLLNDFPYIQAVAENEPEILVKFLLPLSDPNKEPEQPKKEKKRVIKEVKLVIPQEQPDDEEDDDDDEDTKNSVKPNEQDKNHKVIKLNVSAFDKFFKDNNL
uniref:G domain-containing protein n=1 Tax=Strongyloides venezuelensis TaxID=75913 RepID=A0A0K0G420_STRVS